MKSRLIDLIGRNGAIPFDEFMAMCLYDADGGFFTSGVIRPGASGDFVTSPEVSPWFGRFLGRWAQGALPHDDAILVEIGAGSGSLLEPLIDEVGTRFSEVFAMEVSSAARDRIAERVPSATVVSSIAEIPSGRPTVVIVNEVLDNLPARLVERHGDGWSEVKVDAIDGSLSFVSVVADEDLSLWCDTMLSSAPEGQLFAAHQIFSPWLGELAAVSGPLAVCVIDYGGSTRDLSQRQRSAVVRSYRDQRADLDYLTHPGDTDITLDVNADVIAAAAREIGLEIDTTTQGVFLAEHGAEDVLADLGVRAVEMAAAGKVMEQLAARSESVDIRAILDERGLGGFQVFLMSDDLGDAGVE
jgi:SAM-dependent MidA family methyltransferase